MASGEPTPEQSWIQRYPCFRTAEYVAETCYACFLRTACHNSLYRELDRLKAEVTGLRELCQRQDQEIQALRQGDDWPMEYDPETLKEASAALAQDIKEIEQPGYWYREAMQFKARVAELTKERDHYEARCEELNAKAKECDELLEALIDVVHQSCGEASQVDGQLIVDPMALSTYEEALELLKRLGHAKQLGNRRWELFPKRQDAAK